MSWFNFFKKKPAKRKTHNHSKGLRVLFNAIRTDTGLLQQQVQSLQETVNQHNTAIAEHTSELANHKVRFEKLEQLVAQPAISPSIEIPRLTGRIHSPLSEPIQQQKYDMSKFSPQEKRILQVFFEHQDMALSYNDLSQALGKSALTVKNQLHEIRLKADLFTKAIGADNRNRFKLKDGITLQKYLNLS